MAETKFTPGPWRHCPEDNIIISHADGLLLIEWQARSKHVSVEERDANAHLIAAAPELYEALKAMVARIEFYTNMGRLGQPNIEQWEYTEGSSDMANARAALAKAFGEQP